MTKLLMSALVVLTATTASAALKLSGRIDLDNTSYNDKYLGSPATTFKARAQKMALIADGKINDQTMYALELEFAGAAQASAGGNRSGLNNGVKAAYVTHMPAENVGLTLGKFFSDIGGWEGQPSSADMYITSQYQGMAPDYNGVKLAWSNDMMSVALHYAHKDDSPAGQYENTGALAGLVYTGWFMEKALGVMASYHAGKVDEKVAVGVPASEKDITENFATVGVKYDAQPVVVSLDVNMYALENAIMGSYVADASKTALTSLVLGAGYNLGNLTPKLQVSSEVADYKPSEATALNPNVKTTTTKIGLALEYKPVAESDFRYHVAYTTANAKTDISGSEAQIENHFIIGARFSADVLK